jgi:hypothetical protein
MKPVIEEIVEGEAIEAREPSDSAGASQETGVNNEQPEPKKEQAPEPSYDDKKMNLKLIVVITVLSALVAAFVSGGVYVYLSGVQSMKTEPEEKKEISLAPEASPTPEPSATPEPVAVDISKLAIQVLNGSGAIGVASEAKETLTKAGFSVSETGNAGRYDYKNTTIQAKVTVDAQAVEKLKKALEAADYTVEVGSALPSTSKFDLSVIIGAN